MSEARLFELSPKTLFGEQAIITSIEGSEYISAPFEFSIQISSPAENLKPNQVIGKKLSVAIDRGDEAPRWINGYISHLSAGDFSMSQDKQSLPSRIYRIKLVPWLWFLDRSARCFVYLPALETKSLAEVFDVVVNHVKGYGHIDPSFDTSRAKIMASRKYEHMVQYRETDFNFLSRLLEKHGIYYYFEHTETDHKMILADDSSYPEAIEKSVRCTPSMGDQMSKDVITSWQHSYEFVSGERAQTDYDFEKPSTNLYVNTPKHADVEVPNSKYKLYDNPNDYKEKSDGIQEVSRRMEEEEVRYDTVWANSNCKTLLPGYVFKLSEHHSCKTEEGRSYLVTSVMHVGAQPGPFVDQGTAAQYQNELFCIPKERQYRPRVVAVQPNISSVQTAVVVGPKGEEIYTDKYGRVKVQFHWDQVGKKDENTSCWVRCQQSIAGNKWGFMAIPRIGQEVVVDFIEGDPNRPLITGCVYNAEQQPHYTLPDNKTKTYIKTNSTKGGNGHNELMFDDANGEEMLYMHAQKDMHIRVRNDARTRIVANHHEVVGYEKDGKKGGDHLVTVFQDQHQNIKRNQIEHVEGNLKLTVGKGKAEQGGEYHLYVEKERAEYVGGDQHLFVKGDHLQKINGSESASITQDLNVKAGNNVAFEGQQIHIKAGMKLILEAGMQLSLVGPGGFIDIGPAGVAIQGTLVNINSGGAAGSGQGCQPKEPKEAEVAEPKAAERSIKSKSGSKSARK